MSNGIDYRKQGYDKLQDKDFFGAIDDFNEALKMITKDKSNIEDLKHHSRVCEIAWLLSYRGTAKLAVGFLKESIPPDDSKFAIDTNNDAIEDLECATRLHPAYSWAYAQLGDSYRVYARDYYRKIGSENAMEAILRSIKHLETASSHESANADNIKCWIYAHLGAAHMAEFWRNTVTSPPREEHDEETEESCNNAEESLNRAEFYFNEAFNRASKINKNYIWAKRFYAYVLTARGKRRGNVIRYTINNKCHREILEKDDFKKAIDLLNESGESHNPAILQSLSLLRRYMAGQEEDDKSSLYKLSLETAQSVVLADPENPYTLFSMAASSIGLKHLHAKEVAHASCLRIVNIMFRIGMMALVLHLASGGNRAGFWDILESSAKDREYELQTIISKDPLVQKYIKDHDFSSVEKNIYNSTKSLGDEAII